MMITIAAEPASVDVDIDRSALCVVDMQNHDVKPDGFFGQTGVEIGHGQRVIAPIQGVLAAARSAGLTIVYTRQTMPRDPALWPDRGSPWYWKSSLPRLYRPDPQLVRGMWIEGEWGAEIIDELAPQPGDLLVTKTTFSGFIRTEMDVLLRRRDIHYIFFVGIGTPTCVEATVRDAYFQEYWAIVLADCCGAISPATHDQSLFAIKRRYGWVTSSDAVIAALAQAPRGAPAVAGGT